jgi:parallel beta-helix repeat protein/predicted outer membrane repeat protein
LAFVQTPGTTSAGSIIETPAIVGVEDQFGNLVTTDSSQVSIAINSADPTGGALSGVITVDAQNGLATFDSVSVTDVGTYTLQAQDADNSVSPATSASFSIVAPAIIFVDQSAAGANNGQDWADAFPTLQQALNTALPGDTIEVAQGDYSPGDNPTDTFQLLNGVTIQGGYETGGLGGAGSSAFPTILDGGATNYHVVTATGNNPRAVLENVTITGGQAGGGGDADSGFGGGLIADGGSPTIINCLFASNTAVSGGAVYLAGQASSLATLADCRFSNNTATLNAGAIYCVGSSATFTNDAFTNNSAASSGGAVYVLNASPSLTGCLFTGNSAALFGGAIDNDGSSPSITNCTFSDNSAAGGYGGAILLTASSNPTLTNCILWNDTTAAGEISSVSPGPNSPVVNNSDVDGGFAGNNNMNTDPLFVDSSDSNYQLQAVSPCINVGDNTAPGLIGVSNDLAGNPRLFDLIVDMGAFESQAVTVSWTGAADGINWNTAGNWSDNALPTQNDNVIVQGFSTVQIPSGTFAVSDLTDSSPIEIADGGTLILYGSSTLGGGLTIDAGGTLLVPDSDPTVVTANGLNIAAGGVMNLGNNELIASAPLSDIQSYLQTGQLTSSTTGGTLGYLSLPSGQSEVLFTLLGDTDLDRRVNVADLANLAGNFGKTAGATWLQGDFDYNGNVNVADLADLAGNFGKSVTGDGSAAAAAAPAANATAPAVGFTTRQAMPAAAAMNNQPVNTFSDSLISVYRELQDVGELAQVA